MGETTTRPDSVMELLDELGEMVAHARSVPMSASVLVNRQQVTDLMERIHAALPGSVAAADRLMAHADDAVADAVAEASQIVQAARERAAALIESEAVVISARGRAEQIMTDATKKAEALKHEADDYCDRRLGDFEIDLGRIQAQVTKGREKLAERLEDSERPAA